MNYNDQTRNQVLEAIALIPECSVWGMGIKSFAAESETKSDADFITIISEIKSQIEASRESVKFILGDAFNFFDSFSDDFTIKNIIVCDETVLNKKNVIEKIKSLTTNTKIIFENNNEIYKALGYAINNPGLMILEKEV